MGIPVAAIGVVGYGLLFVFSTFSGRARNSVSFVVPRLPDSFALYLTYIEAYGLMTWCVLCLASLGLIFLIIVLAGIVRLRARENFVMR